MTTYLTDLNSKLESTYDAALLSGDLIFTASDTQTIIETEYNIEVTNPFLFPCIFAPS
jgi:hypothetical protein